MPTELVFICDHDLDPRLERKLGWLLPRYDEASLYIDRSRSVGGSRGADYDVEPYENAAKRLASKPGDRLIYVAGNRVLKDHCGALAKAARTTPMVWEIADLPLRRNPVVDSLISLAFRGMLRYIHPAFVVTAPAFLDYLPGGKPRLVAENTPELHLAQALAGLESPEFTADRPVRIGFPGVVRYFRELKALTDFAARTDDLVEIHVWGGPESAWSNFCDFAGIDATRNPNIHYHGPYAMNESGASIYSAIDIVWAVYDNRQLNVRLALPNRFYEAVLAGRWVLVSRKTALEGEVDRLGVGRALDLDGSAATDVGRQIGEFIEEIRSRRYPAVAREKVLAKSLDAKEEFLRFIDAVTIQEDSRGA